MFVPDVRRLDRISPGAHFENQIDDFFQRRVGDVRHVPAAEAYVIPNAVFGNPR